MFWVDRGHDFVRNGADDERTTYAYTPTGLLDTRTLSKSNGTGGWTQEQQAARTYFDNVW